MACISFVARVRTPPVQSNVLERIQDYIRRYAAEQREVERTGPFLATFGRYSSGPYLNYAVPDDHSEPSDEEVAQLAQLYERRRLRPRVELVPGLAPEAVTTLRRAGFRTEGVLPLMACTDRTISDVRRPDGFEIEFAADDAQYAAVVEIRHAAFDEPGHSTAADAQRARSNVEGGGSAVIAIRSSSGEAVASGACLIPYGGVTELTSVGVLARCRRKGIGAFVTAALARSAVLSGVEIVYLIPAHDEGERLYERIGFTRVGESLHLGL